MLSSLLLRFMRAVVSCVPSLAVCLAWLIGAWSVDSVRASPGPTVQEVVEWTRLIQPLGHDNDALARQVSPDGRQLFLVTRRADVRTDRNLTDILLLDVRPERLASGRVAEPVRVLRIEAEKDNNDIFPAILEARWFGNGSIVFRGSLQGGPYQAYRLDVASRRLSALTAEPLGIVNFDVSADLRRVVYVAHVANPAMASGARSVVVGTNSFWSVHFGQDDVWLQQRRYGYRVAEVGVPKSVRALGESFGESSSTWPAASISPDGRWAVLPRYEPDRQLAWGQLYPQVAELTRKVGPSRSLDPLGYYSRPISYVPRRFVAYRLDDGSEQVVVDAPDDSRPGRQWRADRLWMSGGQSVVIAGSHLPQTAEGGSTASHVIEYWPDTGRWQAIAPLDDAATSLLPIAGAPDDFLVLDGSRHRRFHRAAGAWREVQEGAEAASQSRQWTLRVDEALDTPPDVVAHGPKGQQLRLTRLNPQFAPATWGSMRPFAWKDAKGRPWEGGLMVPAGFDARRRYPLVIQTYGFSPTRFYRDGANVYDGFTSGFAGRALLREDMLVLAMPWDASSGAPEDDHEQIVAFNEGVRGAIEALVGAGTVDREKVGILGWSATGERVLNLVTFGDVPIRAATLLDGDANTLFSMAITYAVRDGSQNRKENANQGGPYGESLPRWLRNDPSLHTDCIRSALRIETYGREVHNNWDLYALMRRQYKPVELLFFPHGAHALARPSDRMISLQGNVDWYRFWLKGEQRSQVLVPGETPESLREQYRRWEVMAELKRADDTKPACVRSAG
jgi:dipeptidyl aminopeptidase/acylaminoacyl peptidase